MSTVKVIRLEHCPEGNLTMATDGAAGFDLKSAVSVSIPPGERVMIPTGIKIEMPVGMEAQCRPRSGNAIKKGLTLINSPGTIDSDFRGELMVLAYNASPVIPAALWAHILSTMLNDESSEAEDMNLARLMTEWLEANTVRIVVGDRVAQIVFGTYETPELEEATELAESTRGDGGYGSTGA